MAVKQSTKRSFPIRRVVQLAFALFVIVASIRHSTSTEHLPSTDAYCPFGAVATIWALALMLNACVAAFSALVIIVVWISLARGQGWALWGLIAIGAVMTPLVFIAAGAVGYEALLPSVVVAVVYWVGIVLSGCGLLRSRKYSELRGLRT